jgi:hypothetical protein
MSDKRWGAPEPMRTDGILRFLWVSACTVVIAFAGANVANAQDQTGWTLLFEPMIMDGFGHDQQVLSMVETDSTSSPMRATSRPASLDTEAGLAFRFELEWNRSGDWDYGLDGFLFSASRGRPKRTAASDGPSGANDQVVFNAWDRSYESSSPDEMLFFDVLGDTDVAVWTIDAYAIKTLVDSEERRVRLTMGVRSGDFDNDFHGQAGVQDVGGSFYDASSNYDLMIGPLLGISAEMSSGSNTFRGYIGQSVLFGNAQLTHITTDFSGPPTDPPTNVSALETFSRDINAVIPITEFRLNWLKPINERLALGVAANVSIWWDVSVPPGVVPATEADRSNENTIVFFGIGAALRFDF